MRKSVNKLGAVRTLLALAKARAPLRVEDLRELSGLPISTLYRDLKDLSDHGLAMRISAGLYSVSPQFLETSRRYQFDEILAETARPILRKLSKRTGLTAHLGILDEAMVLYLVKQSVGETGLFTREGQKLEAYCSAVGKVLLAALPADEIDRYLSDEAVALTRFTLTERSQIEEEIIRVSQLGFAEDRQEVSETLACMAAPVRSPDGKTIAAISLSGESTDRAAAGWILEDEEGRLSLKPSLLGKLTGAAEDISKRLYP